MDDFEIPIDLRISAPWLSEDYVRQNGRYLTGGSQVEIYRGPFGNMITKSIRDVRAGDIIIYDDFDEPDDRFLPVTEENIKSLLFSNSFPVGVVVSPPNPSSLERTIAELN